MNGQDQRPTPPTTRQPAPRVPEWIRRMQEGKLKAKDTTGEVTL